MAISGEIIWLLAGIVMIFFEFFIPSFVIAFFGGGALVTALTTWLKITPSLELQLLVFIVSSILLLVFLRTSLKKVFFGKQEGAEDTQDFNIEIGKIVPVIEYIEPGEVGGKVRYQGTTWGAKASQRIAPGESVKIKGCENLTLVVEKINKEE